MFRNFIRQSQHWTKNIAIKSSRPLLGKKLPIQHSKDVSLNDMKPVLNLFDKRWYGKIGKDEFNNKLNTLCTTGPPAVPLDDLLTDHDKRDNIDSHDNSLYHESLTKKNNHKYSIQSIVDDYNRRWKENITVEDYFENFTIKHRGAC